LNDFLEDEKAQGALEYLLILGGVAFVVVAVALILRGSVFPAAKGQINDSYKNFSGALGQLGAK